MVKVEHIDGLEAGSVFGVSELAGGVYDGWVSQEGEGLL